MQTTRKATNRWEIDYEKRGLIRFLPGNQLLVELDSCLREGEKFQEHHRLYNE